MQTLNKKTIIVTSLLLGLLLFGLLLIINKGGGFRLVGSIPDLSGQIATSTGTIKLTFSDKLDGSVNYSQQTEGQDAGIVASTRTEGENLFLVLKPLQENRSYSLELTDIKSAGGEVIARLELSFTAVYVPFNKLSKEQREFELSETDRGNKEDPLMAHLPHQGESIYLTGEYTESEEGEPIFVVNAQIFLRRDDLEDRTAAIKRYKQKVVEYIQSKGLDPASYLVRYIINEAPAGPS